MRSGFAPDVSVPDPGAEEVLESESESDGVCGTGSELACGITTLSTVNNLKIIVIMITFQMTIT